MIVNGLNSEYHSSGLHCVSIHSLSNNSLTQQVLLDVANTLCTCENVSVVDVR